MLLEKVAGFARMPSKSSPALSNGLSLSINISECQPLAKRWNNHLSTESSARTKSTLKASSKLPGPGKTSDNMISLGTARPDSQYYPWQSLDIVPTAAAINISSTASGVWQAYSLAEALNYGPSAGSPQVLRFVTEHVEMIHHPPYADWQSSLTCGTTSALDSVLRMLCNRGDFILTEDFTYSGMLEAAKPLGLNVVGVEMDTEGLVPENLDDVLRNWDESKGPRPRVLYTIPTGQNPKGITQPPARRKEIYRVAEQHDLIIVEDDPYYFLPLNLNENGILDSSADEFIARLPPSYLSLDTARRVIRLDTTSKILAPGLRCGWITACSQLIEKFLSHTEFSTTSPSGPSQMMMHQLLVEIWGHQGFIDWLMWLSQQYSLRLRITVEACRNHIPSEICQWSVPSFGMFVWLEIDWLKHPLASSICATSKDKDVIRCEVEDKIYQRARRNGVQVSKGSWFTAETSPPASMNFRITFAAASQEVDVEEAITRLGRAVWQEFQ